MGMGAAAATLRPPLSRVVDLSFADLPRTSFPGAHVHEGGRQQEEDTQIRPRRRLGAGHPAAAAVIIGCLMLGRQGRYEDAQGTNDDS